MTTLRPSRRSVLGLLGAVPLATGGLLAVPASAHAGAESDHRGSDPVPADLRPGGALDQLIAQSAATDRYSGTLLLLHNGRPVLSRTYGMADKEQSIPNRPDTIFALGSITKIFTGIAIGQLVQQGKVAYHEKLSAYLTGFPAAIGDTVTVHQLLTHTSGLADVARDSGDVLRSWTSEAEVTRELLKLVQAAPLLFPPGTGYTYSNNGYITLAYIVAAVSGQSFYDYVRKHIFRPAGMISSDFYNRDQWDTNRRIAHPYAPPPSGGARVDNHLLDTYIGHGASGAFSTTPDLTAFVTALTGGKLLDTAYTWLATTPKFPAPPLPPKPGLPAQSLFECYGLSAVLVNDHWGLGHKGGTTMGISTALEWYPANGYVYVNLCNYEAGSTTPIDTQARLLITGAGEHRPHPRH
ncbi:serine hydrolase domain-containing protein [Micromonospora ureilytica]|uniref:CubicO group peptidase (Beta-lactamase class C family) n=1 Tax=Micromonospora ureilytica TaxID=709868 RepID=A0ABS0JBL6_9ACTN|nr:serine hydrolase domain-containing protein [Micromonospora ureilytica]MBG6064344.1 CubicO group peptidase (beta-lactamase class C family) [Micromonospora ureilytica]